jgi:release factor glutamine methyltransferase
MYSTLRAIKTQFENELSDTYNEREVQQLFYRVVHFVTGLTRTDVVLDVDRELPADHLEDLSDILHRLKQNEPIQYIEEQAYFLDDVYYVNQHVLIPRPETEELVQWILEIHDSTPRRVLDIGTGSGIVPVSLAKNRTKWQVFACDVSNEALVVARRNAREILHMNEVQFYHEDILNPKTEYHTPLDIIVSNPPYVLYSDKNQMAKNVLDYEPHLALFVEDEDPLLFYREIAKYGQENLAVNGWLYFEIHEDLADKMKELLAHLGYSEIDLRNDMQGKARMVRAKK